MGPYDLPAGKHRNWSSMQEDEFIDILAISDKPRAENSSGYDVILVTRTLFPKGEKRPSKAIVYLASFCRLSSPGALLLAADGKGGEKEENKRFPLGCAIQKAQNKTGIFNLEEVYGLEAITMKKNDAVGENIKEKPPADEEDSSSAGDCVICLSDPR